MNVVSRFEANVLRILRFFLRREPAEAALPLVTAGIAAPPCLSKTAVRLVADSLAKGTVLLLARAGGWRRERHLRGDKPVEGRLWERTPPAELGLSFSPQSLEFLLWVTSCDPQKPRADAWAPETKSLAVTLTVGDRLLLYFAYAALRQENAHELLGLPQRAAFAQDGLCRLAFPEDFTPRAGVVPDFAPWTNGVGACILEALQTELAARWIEVECSKEGMEDFSRMRTVGLSQEQVLDAFLDAVEQAGRLDLARFLLRAAAGLLHPGATARQWVGALAPVPGQRLSDRTETHRSALAFVRQMERLKAWERRARGAGYFDEGYAAAQLWLADWERADGNALHARAAAIVRQLDPLKPSEGQP